MALGKDYANQDCVIARALELVGERWTMLIVRDAFYGVRRYSDFLAHLDLPRAVLAERLSSLTEAGVLAKRRYSDAPVREEYVLTEMGLGLWPMIASLWFWGGTYLTDHGPQRKLAHAECGTELTGGIACPRCGRMVPPAEIEVRPGPRADLGRTDSVSVALRVPRRLLEPIRGETAAV